MLLHVIEAAVPIDVTVYFAGGQGRFHHVRDALAFIFDLHQCHAADGARVVRLPAGRGIEGRAVQIDAAAILRTVRHPRAEFTQVGIGVVEAIGHLLWHLAILPSSGALSKTTPGGRAILPAAGSGRLKRRLRPRLAALQGFSSSLVARRATRTGSEPAAASQAANARSASFFIPRCSHRPRAIYTGPSQ